MTRRTALKAVLASTLGSTAVGATYGIGVERHALQVTAATLPIANLPQALDGLRLGFLTDIHHSALVPAADVIKATGMAIAAHPDLIVLGGDYVTFGDRAFVHPVAELLGALRAPHGVFAILGNHDDDRDMPAALASNGISVLRDQRTDVSIRGELLSLVGIRFWTRKAESIARLMRGAARTSLLLAHDPRRLTEAAALTIPGVLSGHTHGGQVVVPGVGAIARRSFPLLAGIGARDQTSIFVSRGVGTIYVPIRINCPPEVAVITLRRQPTT